jgi:hypothetical protein
MSLYAFHHRQSRSLLDCLWFHLGQVISTILEQNDHGDQQQKPESGKKVLKMTPP